MPVRSLAMLCFVFLLSGCATRVALQEGVEEIVWQDQSAFMCGRCDGLKLVARSDGTLAVERSWISPQGREITSRRRRAITATQFAAFQTHLAALRGRPNVDQDTCGDDYITDQGGFVVTWRRPRLDQFQFDYGCNSQPQTREILATAPNVFGIIWPQAE